MPAGQEQELCVPAVYLLCVHQLAKTLLLMSPGEMKGILKLAQSHSAETNDVAGQQHLQATYVLECTVNHFPWSSTNCLAGLITQKDACAGGTRGQPVVNVALMSFTATLDV